MNGTCDSHTQRRHAAFADDVGHLGPSELIAHARPRLTLLNTETGELLDYDAFEQLQMDREHKIENMVCWSKSLDAEAKAIRDEEKELAERRRTMERSELVAESLGEHVFDFFLRNKRREWEDYRHQVTAFELERLLPRL